MYNYDLKDEDTYYWINQLCLSDQPIPFYNINIYIPNMKEIMSLRPNVFNSLCVVFSYTKDCFDILRDIDIFNTLDCFYQVSKDSIENGINNFMYILVEGISFFTRINKNNIKIYSNEKSGGHVEIVIENPDIRDYYGFPLRFCIDGKKFDELCGLIRLICGNRALTKEDVEKQNEDELLKEEYQALAKAKNEKDRERIRRFYDCLRRNYKEEEKRGLLPDTIQKKSTKILNVYRVVSNYWKSYEATNKLNIYQMNKTYEFITYDIRNQYDIGIATSGFASKEFNPIDIRTEGAI